MANIAKRGRDWFRNEDDRAHLPTEQHRLGYMPASYFGPLSHFFWDIDRMFDSAFRNFGAPALMGMQTFRPNIDIAANDNEYIITCEVPGLDEKDIKLDISPDGMLAISGEKRFENSENRKDTYSSECSYGAFERTLVLPEDVERDNIQARFKNGVLTIMCPRLESIRQSRREIPIGGGKNEGARASYSSGSERASGAQAAKKSA